MASLMLMMMMVLVIATHGEDSLFEDSQNTACRVGCKSVISTMMMVMMTMMTMMLMMMMMMTQVENYKILDNYSQPLKQSTTGFFLSLGSSFLISGLELLLFFFFRRNSWICGSSHKGD